MKEITVSEAADKADMTQLLENKTYPNSDEVAVSAVEQLSSTQTAAESLANCRSKMQEFATERT